MANPDPLNLGPTGEFPEGGADAPAGRPTGAAPVFAGLARIIRARAARIEDEESTPRERDDAELLRVLARLLEGKSPHQAFGAPGDWGYGTPIGDALAAAYRRHP